MRSFFAPHYINGYICFVTTTNRMEIWKPAPYPIWCDYFEVSNLGRVRSKFYTVSRTTWRGGKYDITYGGNKTIGFQTDVITEIHHNWEDDEIVMFIEWYRASEG